MCRAQFRATAHFVRGPLHFIAKAPGAAGQIVRSVKRQNHTPRPAPNNNFLLIMRNACIMPSDCRKGPTPMAEAGAGTKARAAEKEPHPSERNDISAAWSAGRQKGGQISRRREKNLDSRVTH